MQKQERDDNRKIFDVYDGNLEKEYPKHFTPIDREYISKYSRLIESRSTNAVKSKFGKPGESYELFPLDDMIQFYQKLDDQKTSKTEIEEFLEDHKKCFWGTNNAPEQVTISDVAFTQMKKWPKKPDEKRDIWRHSDYKNPKDIFKLWLFPTWASGVGLNYESGDWIGRFGIQKTGKKLLPYSTLELYGDYNFNNQELDDLGFTYNFFRGRHQGWYGGLAWGGIQEKSDQGVRLDHLAVNAGFVPIAWDLNALPVVGKSLPHTQITFRVGLRGEIHKSLAIAPIKFQIGINLMQPIIGPKHPLTY